MDKEDFDLKETALADLDFRLFGFAKRFIFNKVSVVLFGLYDVSFFSVLNCSKELLSNVNA